MRERELPVEVTGCVFKLTSSYLLKVDKISVTLSNLVVALTVVKPTMTDLVITIAAVVPALL